MPKTKQPEGANSVDSSLSFSQFALCNFCLSLYLAEEDLGILENISFY